MSGIAEACADPEESSSSSTVSSGSSSPQEPQEGDMDELLKSFRQQWHRELNEPSPAPPIDDQEATARRLFLQGAAREAEGRLHEATSCYRRALQLVPDIEGRVYAAQQQLEQQQQKTVPEQEKKSKPTRQTGMDKQHSWENLMAKFQRLHVVCVPGDRGDVMTSHISRLPPELLLLVLRWVVSSELDLHSLETCALVCRAFYVSARDPEIWRLVCHRIWGSQQHRPGSGSISWREHVISQPRVHFHGCYISRTSYIRPGEQSFQELYRLWHAVDYYRYIRFFPGGRVLMLTSAEEPAAAVAYLRTRQPRNSAVLTGVYQLSGPRVLMELRPMPTSTSTVVNNRYVRGRRVQTPPHDSGERTFHVELEIATVKNRNSSQLTWQQYCVETRYRSAPRSICPFDISPGKFPPLWFSRVRSYTGLAETCLE